MKKVGSVALRLLGCFIAFDLIGVAVTFVFDIVPSRNTSSLLTYAVWFVLGAFCGFLGYGFAGAGGGQPKDWADKPGSDKTGLMVVATAVILIAVLSWVFYLTMWRAGIADDSFAPDNVGLTATFFMAALGAMILAHTSLRPSSRGG